MEAREQASQSIDSQIVQSLRKRGRGSVFVPADFLDIGSREAVDVALHRLNRKGTIRRLSRGVYDYPKEHPVLGSLQPSAEAVAQALAGRDHARSTGSGGLCSPTLLGLLRASAPQGRVPDGWPEPNGQNRSDDNSASANDPAKHGGRWTTERPSDSSLPRTGQRTHDPPQRVEIT